MGNLIVSHGIIQLNKFNSTCEKFSATIINNKFVITSGHVFSSYFGTNLFDHFIQKSILCAFDKPYFTFVDMNFEITNPEFEIFPLKLLYMYLSKDIHLIMKEFYENNFQDQFQLLINSLICVFIIVDRKLQDAKNSIILNYMQKITGSSTKLLINSFLSQLSLIDNIKLKNFGFVNILCVPFGNKEFFNTQYKANIASVIGKYKYVIVLSTLIQCGCEGSPIFSDVQNQFIGIVLCTTLEHFSSFYKRNITIGVKFSSELIHQFIENICTNITQVVDRYPRRVHNNDEISQYLLMINTGKSMGSGVLVSILRKKFILSCSHLFDCKIKTKEKDNANITCTYAETTFQTNLIWRNEKSNRFCDIAILEAPQSIEDKNFMKIIPYQPKPTDPVYMCGMSFVKSTNTTNSFINVSDGHMINKFDNGNIIFNGVIFNGNSGGAVMNKNLQLIGIISKTITVNDQIYRGFNFGVSLYHIKDILELFALNNDTKILNDYVFAQDAEFRKNT